ncbi:MAG: ferrous iron transporter B [Endomicrobiales bacterium]|nr:ferrous iron transporter B [Endomicrobiales bacterium]
MEKVLLVGNPNVGKSALFSRLTGVRVVVSNYIGTTVEFTQGRMKIGKHQPMIIDVPGTYSLRATNKAEEVAIKMIKEGDVIINVVDSTNLERNLFLTLQLLEQNIPVIVALNMWDDTKHKGINIDARKLEQELGIPVVPTSGLSGLGIKELAERLPEAKSLNQKESSDSLKWKRIGKIVSNAQKLTHRHHSFLDMLEDLSVHPYTGLPIALVVMFFTFWIIRFVGEGLIGYVLEPVFNNLWLPVMSELSVLLGEGSFLHNIFIGSLIDGKIDFGTSFGVLTTGLFVPVVMVLPYIISFYLVLGLMEDFGYLPRFSVLVDNIMHVIGLHGYAIIPMILGLGCNVPGALALRILDEKREKFIAATLMAIAVPCMAQIAVIAGLVGKRGAKYLFIIFGVLVTLFIIKGFILNKVLKGTSPEILIEIPPYRMPNLILVLKKLWMRLVFFLKEAVPFVLLGVLFVNILHTLKIIDFLSDAFAPILVNLWGIPKEATSALIIGFLRKDVAVGMLGPLNLTNKQLVIGCTILAIYFPCIATFAVLIRELGIKDMIKISLIMISVALAVGTLLNIIL